MQNFTKDDRRRHQMPSDGNKSHDPSGQVR